MYYWQPFAISQCFVMCEWKYVLALCESQLPLGILLHRSCNEDIKVNIQVNAFSFVKAAQFWKDISSRLSVALINSYLLNIIPFDVSVRQCFNLIFNKVNKRWLFYGMVVMLLMLVLGFIIKSISQCIILKLNNFHIIKIFNNSLKFYQYSNKQFTKNLFSFCYTIVVFQASHIQFQYLPKFSRTS